LAGFSMKTKARKSKPRLIVAASENDAGTLYPARF
jgi:hypothetical protein